MQNNSFSVLFFIKKSKLLKNGEVPICMRITVNNKRAEVQVKRSVEPDKWNHLKGCAVGKDRKHQEINLYLETARNRVFQIHRQLEADGKPITAVTIKNIFYGGYDSPKMLIKTFNEHNQEYRELMDKEYAKGTVLRYERTVRYLVEFMREQYNCADIPLKSINYEFITQFEHFIKTQTVIVIFQVPPYRSDTLFLEPAVGRAVVNLATCHGRQFGQFFHTPQDMAAQFRVPEIGFQYKEFFRTFRL